MAKKEKGHCSFCGRPEAETTILVSGIDSQICNFCIEQAKFNSKKKKIQKALMFPLTKVLYSNLLKLNHF